MQHILTDFYLATSAYEDLAKILTHSEFQKDDVIKNIHQIQKWQTKLSLVKVQKHEVPLCIQQTLFTSTSTKQVFTISLLTYLERILKNLFLMSKMYFGPEIVANKK